MRADAERSTARILEAAGEVLAVDPNASLERIADAAGLARATVHRRFASRRALLEALVTRLNERYLLAFEQARVATAPPVGALHRLAEIVLEVKVSHRFTIGLSPADGIATPGLAPEVVAGLDLLFTRLHAAGAIAAPDPVLGRETFLALLHVAFEMPADSTCLVPAAGGPAGLLGARADLLVRTVLGALGGRATA